ncbi:L,D-transpeptidase family protein [Leisingera sp. M658]|uniref:L,D-transpeptidase family protein n=1 Tax=Leisingera sp. M658 TaxID=2867015 RepID=UPI0021A9222F|nr:L,D-transpeptidase family protein [Leisingera sp. M658]UWQ74042.1 hypothetical protein K3724_16090 [Leisingera sp. M658]
MNGDKIVRALIIIASCVAVGWVGHHIGAEVTPTDNWSDAFWPRFQQMFIFAVLIERSVEVYLNASHQNGDDRFAPAHRNRGKNATPVANTAAIVLSLLVATAGVRLMATLGQPEDPAWITSLIWHGTDIIVSAGLMAGGAVLFHELAEIIRGGFLSVSTKFETEGQAAGSDEAHLLASYTITVTRTGKDTGKLEFSSGSVSLDETCWWDPNVKIAAGTYTKCSKTRMSSKKDSVTGKKRPGIYLPDAVVPGTDNHSIFIHEGKDPSWSDGCIVLTRDKMMEMWNEITPMDGKNVTVKVIDA